MVRRLGFLFLVLALSHNGTFPPLAAAGPVPGGHECCEEERSCPITYHEGRHPGNGRDIVRACVFRRCPEPMSPVSNFPDPREFLTQSASKRGHDTFCGPKRLEDDWADACSEWPLDTPPPRRV